LGGGGFGGLLLVGYVTLVHRQKYWKGLEQIS
jgi:hypothetical protein